MQPTDTHTAVVVDDSHFMRTVIADVLESGGIDVVATAADGGEALSVVRRHRPDVVTMDVEMPAVGGLEAVSRIMEETPTPILMLSAHTEDDADVTFDAIERGAVDFFTKPGGEVSTGMVRFEDQLLRKVRAVARSSVGSRSTDAPDANTFPEMDATDHDANPTLVVGASTGGPHAVESLLGALPITADFRVLVVQHMPDGFTERFAARLDRASAYAVSEAADGMTLRGGEATVAPGGAHLVVGGYRAGVLELELSSSARRHGVRPAIDVTMESAASVVDDALVAVVLTGMGSDGAAGIECVHAAGGVTVAQDEATSPVFGMPRRAIETGCVDIVAPLAAIPRAVVENVTREAAA